MISSLDPASLSFLNGLNLIQRRSEAAQRELTTGLRINTVSDDPSQIPNLLATRAHLDRTTQIGKNLGQVKAEVDTAEGALESAVKLVERARTLGTQGQSALTTADSRTEIATELGGVLEQLAGLSNTTVGGRYVFSGDNDQKAAYSIDLSQVNPISAYLGSAATRQVQHPDGSTFAVSKTAQQLFDSSLQSINSLRTALLNNDQTAITDAVSNLGAAGTTLNGQLAFYGTVQNRVADAQEYGSNLETQLQTQLSGIQDADLTHAITEFQQATTNQQAALASRAKLPHTSLFDYLA
ncbi:MAG: flagellin [Bryobacteraceae bacterium]